MIPVHVEPRPGQHPSIVVPGLILACTLVFAWQMLLILRGDRPGAYSLALVPAQLTVAVATGQYLAPATATLVTSMFLHANLTHLGLNMLFLGLFGRRIEDRLGHLGFAVFFLLAGVTTSLTYVLLQPGSHVHLLGASGAISAVLGAFTVLFPRLKVRFLWPMWTWTGTRWRFTWTEEIKAAYLLLGWLAFQAVFALRTVSGVAWLAHIIGFALGMLFALPLRRPPETGQTAPSTDGPPEPDPDEPERPCRDRNAGASGPGPDGP